MEDQQAQGAPSASEGQGRVVMRKLPLDSRARRRLFSDELAKDINLACARSLRNESIFLAVKWNFDFAREVPLEGPIKWYRKDGDTWYGMQPSGKTAALTKKKNIPEEADMREIRPRRYRNTPLPAQSRARRRLLLDEMENAKECSSVENTLNKIMEETHKQKKLKWNFDFQNEQPLEGPIQWYRKESGKGWYAMVPVKEEEAETMAAEADKSNDSDDTVELSDGVEYPVEPTNEIADDPVEPDAECVDNLVGPIFEIVDDVVEPIFDRVDDQVDPTFETTNDPLEPTVEIVDQSNEVSAENEGPMIGHVQVQENLDQDVEMVDAVPIEMQNTDQEIPNDQIEENLASMEIQSTSTPKNERGVAMPQVRKRKREVVNVNRAKKRISFF